MAPKQLRSSQKGFAYLALLVVVAVIGVVSSGALLAGRVMARHVAEDELLFIGGQFRQAFQAYHDATPIGQPRYPKRIEDLLLDPRFGSPRRYLRKIFVDPLTGKASWGLVSAPDGGVLGVYSLAEETPIRMADFPDAWANLKGKRRRPPGIE